MHVACQIGNLEVVKFLLKARVNLDQIDSSGCSPLFYAVTNAYESISYLLALKGASAHAPKEKLGYMLCSIGSKGDLKRLKLLNKCEANLEIADYDHRTVAHLAASES